MLASIGLDLVHFFPPVKELKVGKASDVTDHSRENVRLRQNQRVKKGFH